MTKTTNNRISELEKEIAAFDYEIMVLNSKTQITLNKELISFWIKKMVENANDNRADFVFNFINKVILFDDKIIIAYNYSDENKNKATTVAEIKNTTELQEFDRTSYGTHSWGIAPLRYHARAENSSTVFSSARSIPLTQTKISIRLCEWTFSWYH